MNEPLTVKQADYIDLLRRKHHISREALAAYCRTRFGYVLRELDKGQASALIDDMAAWEQPPPALRRAIGQLDMFGEEARS